MDVQNPMAFCNWCSKLLKMLCSKRALCSVIWGEMCYLPLFNAHSTACSFPCLKLNILPLATIWFMEKCFLQSELFTLWFKSKKKSNEMNITHWFFLSFKAGGIYYWRHARNQSLPTRQTQWSSSICVWLALSLVHVLCLPFEFRHTQDQYFICWALVPLSKMVK